MKKIFSKIKNAADEAFRHEEQESSDEESLPDSRNMKVSFIYGFSKKILYSVTVVYNACLNGKSNDLYATKYCILKYPGDSEKRWRVYTSTAMMARHVWCVYKSSGRNTQKSEYVFRRCHENNFRV